MRIYGIDFTCAPRKAKPITVASGLLKKNLLEVLEIERLESFAAFEASLARPGPWIGGFDFPFSLPRELVRDLGWPEDWRELVAHCSSMDRATFRSALDAYRASRPIGRKYAHRATDYPAGSSSPMKLVNPPVALMFHEGAPRIVASGAHVPHLLAGDRSRGKPLGLHVKCHNKLKSEIVADGSGDLLDAVICATQAAWAWTRRRSNYGLPADVPPGEGWILTA